MKLWIFDLLVCMDFHLEYKDLNIVLLPQSVLVSQGSLQIAKCTKHVSIELETEAISEEGQKSIWRLCSISS